MDAANEFALVYVGDLPGCLLRHPIAVRVKGDAPIQKETQFGAHGMGSRFHHYKLTLGDGFQFIWCHESTLHHLQGLAALFPLTDGAGQYRPATEGSGEGICRFALGRKAAKDGVLAVVTYNFRTFFTIVLLQLGKALDNGYQRQPTGASRAE